ncbi:MAG TPA: HEPN domain-containing protein [Patescibacteria group bacterium]|nr:HEPN domain-containing protein [Patescibacteria group bacterium]
MKNDALIAKRLIEQTLTNWVNPEIEKRKSEDKLPSDFRIKAAQVIFSVGGPPLVRINSEVKVIIEAKFNRPIEKGEAVLNKDIEDIRSFRLIDEEKDFGHITIVKLTKGWFVGFSFIYDVSKSKEIYDIAIEFMKSAHAELEAKRYRPFVESAFVAAENLAKARIYLLPDQEIRKTKTHGLVHGKVNRYARTSSIIKTDQKDVFNELKKLRERARYDPRFSMEHKTAEEMFEALRELSKEVFRYLVRFGELSDKASSVS